MNISITFLRKSLWLSGSPEVAFPQVDLPVVQRAQAHLTLFVHIAKLSFGAFGRSAFSSHPGQCSALKTLESSGGVTMACDRPDVHFLGHRQERACFQVLIGLCSSAAACSGLCAFTPWNGLQVAQPGPRLLCVLRARLHVRGALDGHGGGPRARLAFWPTLPDLSTWALFLFLCNLDVQGTAA